MKETLAIIDYGSQYTQLIARRIRELGVYAVILPSHASIDQVEKLHPKGLILSGGPNSVYENGAPALNRDWLNLQIPILGLCYGMQLLTHSLGGKVSRGEQREGGGAYIQLKHSTPLLQGLQPREAVWMSHGDHVEVLAPQFVSTAITENGILAGMADESRRIYGLQFHPEVEHTPNGNKILANFLFQICGYRGGWSVDNYLGEMTEEIRAKVGDRPVISFVSGGVDSTVATALLLKALPSDQIYAIHIDSGLMRLRESEQVMRSLTELGLKHFHLVEAQHRFLNALKGVHDPEAKRHIIGDLFVDLNEEALTALALPSNSFLCQGTLYTDLIESGLGVGKKAATIKTHHNVGSPQIQAKRQAGLLVEPNRGIFKDEVRELGESLGLPHDLLWRHPFPGPGLAIRTIGEITEEKLNLLRQVDDVYTDELRRRGLYEEIWQAFAILTDSKSVGVLGDGRTYEWVVALRAVRSTDGMTADPFPFDWHDLQAISNRITNEVRGVNRIVYDVTSKPPGTIEWE